VAGLAVTAKKEPIRPRECYAESFSIVGAANTDEIHGVRCC
jgi:hypothetical protein